MADFRRQMRDQAEAITERARDAASAAYDRSMEALDYATRESSSFIRSYPLSTVLVAFGVGVSVGFLLSKGLTRS